MLSLEDVAVSDVCEGSVFVQSGIWSIDILFVYVDHAVWLLLSTHMVFSALMLILLFL